MHIPTIYLPILAAALFVSQLQAQSAPQPGYLNTALPAEQRARDLVRRMTLEEKATQLVNQARAIPRLNVPPTTGGARRCTAWRERHHGVS
jgi:hypothetical protein